MTRRDLAWRVAGLALSGASCAVGARMDSPAVLILVFPLAFVGLPLMIHGKRVAQMVRTEHRGRHHTADVVHAARLRRRD